MTTKAKSLRYRNADVGLVRWCETKKNAAFLLVLLVIVALGRKIKYSLIVCRHGFIGESRFVT
jgi:hypothetical protein